VESIYLLANVNPPCIISKQGDQTSHFQVMSLTVFLLFPRKPQSLGKDTGGTRARRR